MNKIINCFLGIIIPLIGTTIGSSLVFFISKKLNKKIENLLIGLSIGIMLAASIFSLLIPSIEIAQERNILSYIPASIGLILGFIFLISINKITKRLNDKKMDMLMFSVTIHNIPEGMAVGVLFAGYLTESNISLMECMLLSIGIALQNIPEGSIISIPLLLKDKTKFKSFVYGFLSGVVEPLFAFLTILLLNIVVPLLPYLLAFASGAMIYVIIEELVPSMNKNDYGLLGVLIGFIIMMILDLSF